MRTEGNTRGWAVGSLCVVLALAGPAAQAADWEWTAIPYVWAAGAGLDVEINDNEDLGGDIAFSDIVDKLEFALMAHFEGRAGKAGFFVDGAYLSTEDSTTTPENPPLLPDGAEVDAGLKMGRYEGAGFLRLIENHSAFDLFLGVRVIDFEQQVDIYRATPTEAETSASASDTLTDVFFGARFGMPFGKRYWFNVRADIGTGSTERSWTANAGLGVWFGQHKKYGMNLMYEHFEFEVENPGDLVDVKSNVRMSGPLVGFVFRF